MHIKNYFLYLILLLSFTSHSQVFDFQSINQENGLPSSNITSMFQDSRNIIWLGTNGGGLVKYDGSDYSIYDKSKGLLGNFITSIVEDDNKNLVVATNYDGIFIYDGNKFKNISSKTNAYIKSNNFFKLIKCTTKIIAISDLQVVILDLNYSIKVVFNNKGVYNEVNSAECENGQSLVLASSNGLFHLDLSQIDTYSKITNNSTTITKSAGKTLFVADETATIYTLENLKLKLFKSLNLKNYPITAIYASKSGALWISSFNQNSIKVLRNNTIVNFDKSNGFEGCNVKCFFVDNSKNLYVGTSGVGLFKTHIQQFIGFKNNPYLSNNFIYSILKTDNKLFVATRKDGILEFKVNGYNNFIYTKKYLENFSSDVIIKNNLGNPVFETVNGLSSIINGKVVEYNLKKYFKNNIDVKSIFQDSKNRYFLGSWGNGLLILDSNFKFLKRIFKNKTFFTDYVTTINSLSNSSLLIGTNNGLYKLEEKANLEFKITKLIYDVFSVSTKDSFGNYWFAGTENMYSFNCTTSKLSKFNKKNGLTSTVIYSLIADKNNN